VPRDKQWVTERKGWRKF